MKGSLDLQYLGTAMVVLAVVVAVGIYILVQVNTSLGASTASIINNFVTALGQFGTWASILVSPKRETTLGRVKSWA